MSKKVKKLLEENTIRKFMKYANIETLAENFLDTVGEDDEYADEEEVEVGVDDMGEEPAMDMGEEPAMDMGPEPEEEPAEMAEAEEDEPEEFDYESVVSEVARRVALRLVKESKK